RQHGHRHHDDGEDQQDLDEVADQQRGRTESADVVHHASAPAVSRTGSLRSAPCVPSASYGSPPKSSNSSPIRRNALATSAGAGPSSRPARTTPSTCHAGRASGGGSTPGQKRCTRRSKFVKVPS